MFPLIQSQIYVFTIHPIIPPTQSLAIIEVSKINCPLSLSKSGNVMHHPRYTEYQRLNALVGHSFIIPFRSRYSGHSGFYSLECADFFKIVRDAIH